MGKLNQKNGYLQITLQLHSIIKDSSAGSFYISSTIANLFEKPPLREKTKWIEMMTNETTRKIEIYEVTIETYRETLQWK